MIIKVIAVSKIKEPYIIEGINEYLKRLSGLCTLKIKEVEAQKIKPTVQLDQIKAIEAQKISQLIAKDSYTVALDENGKQFSSLKLAELIDFTITNSGKTEINFIIGGANGLSSEIINKADLVWSLSKLTFPHQLVRLILLEQLYRAFKINVNEPYHK